MVGRALRARPTAHLFSVACGGSPAGESGWRETQNAVAADPARNPTMAAIIHRFTFVVRRWTFTSGNPLLPLSIDITRLTQVSPGRLPAPAN
jgi:hypothetical protein